MKRHFLLIAISLFNLTGKSQSINSFKTIEGTLDELLDQISLEKGEKMDTAAIRNLFLPTAHFSIRMLENDTA
ncbi:hypothetical protein [Flammeovirga sp. MY04]|uniref:hypothetical protein n=1 Tax=Flammeovirga sp. MY04 TaxID=1191459 RepID=UPI00080625FF|nr:hypothetical protein [Flammeovirga sp. MY04]